MLRRPRVTSRSARAAGAAAAAAMAASGAGAAPVAVGWSTYLRAGPGHAYAALTELEHDASVHVLSCDGRWCRVSDGGAEGYVDRDALRSPRTRTPSPPARTGCVLVGQVDDPRPRSTRFCSGRAPGG